MSHEYLMTVQMFLPCYHSNESPTVLYCFADVVHNGVSRKKVSVMDAEFVTKFI